ncbi:MAG: C2H2-type zinc finger protein [Raineya sp.]|jgi:hypothetical protein|nr:C2H2-type zinc finger protein [Raineya sp.]
MKSINEMNELWEKSQNERLPTSERNQAIKYLIFKCNYQGIFILDFIESKKEKNPQFAEIAKVSEMKSEIKKEVSENLPTEKTFTCKNCGESFPSQNSLNAHSKKHK